MSRAILAAKDNNKKPSSSELKRSASGSGVLGGAHKKRSISNGSQPSTKQETPVTIENEQAAFKIEVETKVEVTETISVDEKPASMKREQPPGVPDLDEEDLKIPSWLLGTPPRSSTTYAS
jgi:hypothetical protein